MNIINVAKEYTNTVNLVAKLMVVDCNIKEREVIELKKGLKLILSPEKPRHCIRDIVGMFVAENRQYNLLEIFELGVPFWWFETPNDSFRNELSKLKLFYDIKDHNGNVVLKKLEN